jgi:hypothetical protein
MSRWVTPHRVGGKRYSLVSSKMSLIVAMGHPYCVDGKMLVPVQKPERLSVAVGSPHRVDGKRITSMVRRSSNAPSRWITLTAWMERKTGSNARSGPGRVGAGSPPPRGWKTCISEVLPPIPANVAAGFTRCVDGKRLMAKSDPLLRRASWWVTPTAWMESRPVTGSATCLGWSRWVTPTAWIETAATTPTARSPRSGRGGSPLPRGWKRGHRGATGGLPQRVAVGHPYCVDGNF